MSQFMGSVELRLSKVEGHEEKLGAFNRSFVETFGHIWEEGYTNGMSWMLGYTSEERVEREKELFAGTCSELSEDDMSDTASYHLVQCYVEGLAQEVPAIGCRAYANLHADYIWGGGNSKSPWSARARPEVARATKVYASTMNRISRVMRTSLRSLPRFLGSMVRVLMHGRRSTTARTSPSSLRWLASRGHLRSRA